MGAILRAYESAKALGELDSVPFALIGSHWLTGPNGELVVNKDGSPHTYWDCKYILQTTQDSGSYMHDGIRYEIDFFGGYDGVWISRSTEESCRYYGFNVGDSPHTPFFGYDFRGKDFDYAETLEKPKEHRIAFAYKTISVWECFDARMLLNLVNGNWIKFIPNVKSKRIKPNKSKVRMAKAIKLRLIRTLEHHHVIEKVDGKYDIHWESQTDFAEFENINSLRNHGKLKIDSKGARSQSYATVGDLRKVYPMKRRPTVEGLRELLGMDSREQVKSLMEQNGFRDTFN